MAATPWTSNAALIADCAALGYLRSDWLTLDPTYGKGNWWTKWQPDRLVTSDLSPSLSTTDLQADFTYLPFQAATCDAVTYDPPYVCVGGRRTSGIESMYDAYGLIRARAPRQTSRPSSTRVWPSASVSCAPEECCSSSASRMYPAGSYGPASTTRSNGRTSWTWN